MAKNVLIVEDEFIIARVLDMQLSRHGFNVLGIADDKESARKLFKKYDVDIIIMDILLKNREDGRELAVELNKIKETPVIFATGNSDAGTRGPAEELPFCVAVLIKPVSKEALLNAVNSIP
ncbi:MAG: response regulator [Leptospiraceae bacterium]|nr:response regulator [Leptospiraceae bacterium]